MSKLDTFAFLRALRDSRTLSRNAKDVGWVLATHGEYAYPGNELLAAEATCSVSSVQRGLKELTAAGAITLVKSGQGSNSKHASVYRLHYPFQQVTLTGSTGHTDLTNTNEIPKTIGDSTGQTDRLKTGERKVTSGPDLSSKAVETSGNPDLSSKAVETSGVKCNVGNCRHVFPPGLDLDSKEFEAAFVAHFKVAHTPTGHTDRLKPQQGMSRQNTRTVQNAAKWECTECGGQFSYLGSVEQKICHTCKKQIEG